MLMDLALERQLWGYPGGVHDICVCCYHTGVSTCVMSVYSDQMGQVWARHTRRHGARRRGARDPAARGPRRSPESGAAERVRTPGQTGERETRTPQSRSAESTAREWVARLTRTAGR